MYKRQRRDIEKLAGLSDVSVSASVREGLPVNLIEAMAIGNAIVATNVRGNRDVVKDNVNGFIVELGESQKMADRICALAESSALCYSFKEKNLEMVNKYSTDSVIDEMIRIYKDLNLL